MTRRSILIVSILVVAALIGAALILFDRPQNIVPDNTSIADNKDSSESIDNSQSGYSAAGSAEGQVEVKAEETAGSEVIEIIKSEEIKVVGNSPEYDLKAYLCKNSKNEEFIKFEYYNSGVGTEKDLTTAQVPELEGVFEKGNEALKEKDGFQARPVYLNARYSKAYITVEGNANADFVKTTMYVFNLKDQSLKKLFSNTGRYTEPCFSADYKYLAYSYYDSPASSIYQENSLLEVISSVTDEFIVKGSRNDKGVLIGGIDSSGRIFDYSFISWNSNSTVRLKETVWTKKTGTSGDVEKNSREVLYDIERNLFLNLNGSIMEKGGILPKQENQKVKQESGAAKTLGDFYSYLGSEKDYNKALEILSDDFTLELNILEQFGVEVLTKDDIDLESASIYADLLRKAKLDSIVKEEAKGDTSTIYYYQLFSIKESSQLRQPIIAQLKKADGKWKILGAKEASGEEAPFKQ